jgi:hypothetical protein
MPHPHAPQVNDFSRGKRLKKLLRLLNSAAARATIIAFRLRMLLLTAAVGVLHVVCFGVLIGRMAGAQTKLQELQAAGDWGGGGMGSRLPC